MPPPRAVAAYRSRDGRTHDVVVLKTPADRWRVLDICDSAVIHVETLMGDDDRLSQATALADDYAAQQDAYHAGDRLDDPLPRLRPLPPAEADAKCAA